MFKKYGVISKYKKFSRMSLIKFSFWIVLFLLTIYCGISLRRIDYASIPEPYIILDEHTNVWHGLSIRKTGIPTAWSILSTYKTDSISYGAGGPLDGFNLSVDGKKPNLINFSSFPKVVVGLAEFDFGRGINNTPLVQPYLDHPPFGAMVLSILVNNQTKTFAEVNDAYLRRSAIALSVITQTLIIILALLITKKPIIGVISSIVYATVPSYLLLSRYALLENVLSPLILLGLIFIITSKYIVEELKTDRFLNLVLVLAGICGGLGALTKLTGWIFILANVILLYLWKFKLKNILFYLIPACLIGILYFVWGLFLSPRLFINLLLLQTGREFIGSINLLVTFFRVNIFNFPLDGWWIGGFITLLLISRKKESVPIIVTVVASLFSALAISGANYPWYFITLIPFMAISVAIFFEKLATNPTFVSVLLAFFVFVSSSLYWGYGVYQKNQPFMLYRLLFLITIGIAIFWTTNNQERKYKKIWYVGVILLLVVLFKLNWQSMNFILENWGKLPLIYTPGTF